MSSNRTLNFFDPNLDIPAHYENQLTRAFLVVLRMCPTAHQEWLSLVAADRKLYNLSRPWTFDTQRGQMLEQVPEVTEPIEGISVIQAADAEATDDTIQITDRSQVLDGLVRYGDDLLIVIETKLAGRVSTRQAKYLNVHGAQVCFDRPVKSVDWRDVVGAWSGLVETEVVTGSERAIIEDFLLYVERHFSQLGPFRKLSQCKKSPSRIKMRLKAVLDEMGGGQSSEWLELPGCSAVNRAYLNFDEDSDRICLVVYPADTLTQAKAFYLRAKSVEQILSLGDRGWSIEPNFHFGHRAKGFSWTTTKVPVDKYVDYWKKRIADTGSIPRDDWEQFWTKLKKNGFATSEDKSEFNRDFTDTKRASATPRPGLRCTFAWSLTDARNLDDRDELVAEVSRQLNIFLNALGEQSFHLSTSDQAN
jgi:hypothetical protein